MCEYFDSHAHFGDEADVGAVVGRAMAAGVTRIMAVGGSPEDDDAARSAARQFPDAVPFAVGLGRHLAGELAGQAAEKAVAELGGRLAGAAAVGEIGLDFHYERDTAEAQVELFRLQLELARRQDLPAIVHSREAEEETLRMLEVYRTFAEKTMALPVIAGYKTEREKFAGALRTYAIEAMMQDRKALQAGTSHNLGQNFAKAFDVTFLDRDGARKHVWATSWGVSTRLIGALIMAHSDDRGLVLPPRLAPIEIVIVPIYRTDEEQSKVLEMAEQVRKELSQKFKVRLDDRDQFKPGFKFSEWELKGVPLRIEIGPRDVEAGQVVTVRRDNFEKTPVPVPSVAEHAESLLEQIQKGLLERALAFQKQNTVRIDDYNTFKEFMAADGSFALIHWAGDSELEKQMSDETKATIRCIPFDGESEEGSCLMSGKPSDKRVYAAKAY